MRRNRAAAPPESPEPAGWDVVISPATKWREDYFYTSRGVFSFVDGEVAVRIVFDGDPKMTFGTVKIADVDFEDKITTLKAEAQERAAALNAVGCTG